MDAKILALLQSQLTNIADELEAIAQQLEALANTQPQAQPTQTQPQEPQQQPETQPQPASDEIAPATVVAELREYGFDDEMIQEIVSGGVGALRTTLELLSQYKTAELKDYNTALNELFESNSFEF